MIRGKKVKNIKNMDGIVRRKKALNFGKVLNHRSFVSLVTIVGILLGLVTNVFLFPIQEVRGATETLRPDGVGSLTQIDEQYPASGAHWDKVDEVTADDGSTYVYVILSWSRDDLYATSHSIPADSTINSVTIYVRGFVTYTGYAKFSPLLKDTTGTYVGPGYDESSWTTHSVVRTTRSNGTAWTLADIDALEVGVRAESWDPDTYSYCTQVYAVVDYTPGGTISISSPADVSLGTIAGTGTASNSVTWQVITDNSAGYKLEWQASAATMSSGGDTIAAYTPAVADTPETWSVAAAASEWGARLSSTSTDTATEWGTDGASEKWLNVNNAAVRQIVTRSSATAGSNEVVQFKAEVGSSKLQPTGTYTVNITMTATTL